MNCRRRGVPKVAGTRGRSNIGIDRWNGGMSYEWHSLSVHFVSRSSVAGLTQRCIQLGTSPHWHQILTICLLSEWMSKVTDTMTYTDSSTEPLFVCRKLCIDLRHDRRFPHGINSTTVSYDPKLRSKTSWIFRLGLLVQSARMMQIEDNALLCITAVQPSRTPAYAIQPKPSDTISTLVLFVLEQLLERLSTIVIRETQPTRVRALIIF